MKVFRTSLEKVNKQAKVYALKKQVEYTDENMNVGILALAVGMQQ